MKIVVKKIVQHVKKLNGDVDEEITGYEIELPDDLLFSKEGSDDMREFFKLAVTTMTRYLSGQIPRR